MLFLSRIFFESSDNGCMYGKMSLFSLFFGDFKLEKFWNKLRKVTYSWMAQYYFFLFFKAVLKLSVWNENKGIFDYVYTSSYKKSKNILFCMSVCLSGVLDPLNVYIYFLHTFLINSNWRWWNHVLKTPFLSNKKVSWNILCYLILRLKNALWSKSSCWGEEIFKIYFCQIILARCVLVFKLFTFWFLRFRFYLCLARNEFIFWYCNRLISVLGSECYFLLLFVV